MDDRLAYVALNAIPDIGPVRVKAMLTIFGTPTAILAARKRDLQQVNGVGELIARAVADWRETTDPDAEMNMAERAGVKIITLADADYPALLKEIHDPPLCLYVRGDVSALHAARSSIAIVGSRHTTSYGVRVAETLAGSAALSGWIVFSGLARGIDTASHDATLRMGGRTVAVIGSGLGRIHPQGNIDLARRIAASGAVVSEFPMHFPPSKRTFPMRNRIISGLTLGTVVVQAGFRSGSLITAAQALDQNRAVFAVPGPIDCPQSRGCHALIKQGTAKLVETFQDILEEFSFLPGLTPGLEVREAGKSRRELASASLTLSESEAKLLALLGNGEIALDELVADSGLGAAEVLGAVFTLELKGIARQLPGRRVVRV